jgi:hypothetical protein
MKNTLFILAAFLMVLGSCTRKLITPQTDELVVTSDEVPAPAELSMFRAASEPDFWEPTYRSYRIVPFYIEVDSIYNAHWKPFTEDTVRARFARIAWNMERQTGLRFTISQIKILTRHDIVSRQTNGNNMLFQFSSTVPRVGNNFMLRISGRSGLGGSAFISRGSLTTAPYAISGFGKAIAGGFDKPGNDEYAIGHEILHNLGISHSHNCCEWYTKDGRPLGRLDSAAAGETTCSPVPIRCNRTTIRQSGGWNSYAHIWGQATYNLHPSVLAKLHRAVFYSSLQTYTPTQPPLPPVTTCSTQVAHTTATGSHPGFEKALDGIHDTNPSRWVVNAPQTSLTLTYNNASIDCIKIWTGFLSGSTWGSPIRQAIVSVNGTQLGVAVPGALEMNIPVNRAGVNTIKIDFFALDSHVRIREVRVLD